MRSILRDAIYRKHKECNCTIRFVPLHSQRVQWNVFHMFYSISCDRKQPIKRSEFNKVLYKTVYQHRKCFIFVNLNIKGLVI
jgi:hypothetical protein